MTGSETKQDELNDFAGLPKQKHRYRKRWRSTVERVKLESSQNNSWFDLIDDLAIRLIRPRYSVPFVMYLLTGVLLLGGVAIWVEIVKYSISSHFYLPSPARRAPNIEAILAAIHTFYPALAWSATMQIVLADAPEGDSDGRPHKRLRALALFLGSVVLVLAVVVMSLAEVLLPWVSLAFGVLGVLIAIVLWWIANAEDDTYKDTPRSIGLAPKGGAAVPNAALPGSAPSNMFGDDE